MATKNLLRQSKGELLLTDDDSLIDLQKVHSWLSLESYWAAGRSFEVLERAFQSSYPIGVYRGSDQVAVARIVSDSATFAWLCDVFIESTHRGRGIGTWLAQASVEWTKRLDIRRIILATRDAHEVYTRAGFQPLADPARWMEIDSRPQARLP